MACHWHCQGVHGSGTLGSAAAATGWRRLRASGCELHPSRLAVWASPHLTQTLHGATSSVRMPRLAARCKPSTTLSFILGHSTVAQWHSGFTPDAPATTGLPKSVALGCVCTAVLDESDRRCPVGNRDALRKCPPLNKSAWCKALPCSMGDVGCAAAAPLLAVAAGG
jgi:hypothetical protein